MSPRHILWHYIHHLIIKTIFICTYILWNIDMHVVFLVEKFTLKVCCQKHKYLALCICVFHGLFSSFIWQCLYSMIRKSWRVCFVCVFWLFNHSEPDMHKIRDQKNHTNNFCPGYIIFVSGLVHVTWHIYDVTTTTKSAKYSNHVPRLIYMAAVCP